MRSHLIIRMLDVLARLLAVDPACFVDVRVPRWAAEMPKKAAIL